MLFQRDTLLPWLTAEDNIGLHFKFASSKVPKDEVRRRVAELIQLAGLEGAEKKYPYQLSGGMRRRVAFLSAVAPLPRTLLLDEPFSSLDEPTRVAIHQSIFDIVKRYRISVVLVTHDLAEAISLSDRVVILSARPGTICGTHAVEFGSKRVMLELRENPRFLELYGELWHELRRQITLGDKKSSGALPADEARSESAN
jgi:ABC-type nitrate/sulfonate/bicarbonate transport system ATPase subunit